jgi:hypothetical protein
MGRLMAATGATNDQGQIPLVERPQGLLGKRELLLLLHACSSLFLRLCGHEAQRLGQEGEAGEVTSLGLWTENTLSLFRAG